MWPKSQVWSTTFEDLGHRFDKVPEDFGIMSFPYIPQSCDENRGSDLVQLGAFPQILNGREKSNVGMKSRTPFQNGWTDLQWRNKCSEDLDNAQRGHASVAKPLQKWRKLVNKRCFPSNQVNRRHLFTTKFFQDGVANATSSLWWKANMQEDLVVKILRLRRHPREHLEPASLK
jgi:hypothetical protein